MDDNKLEKAKLIKRQIKETKDMIERVNYPRFCTWELKKLLNVDDIGEGQDEEVANIIKQIIIARNESVLKKLEDEFEKL